MAKKLFTKSERELLKRNPYIDSVCEKAITYSNEFKLHFIMENEKGKIPRKIFEEAGLDVELIGIDRVNSSATRWRAAYRQFGVSGLENGRKAKSENKVKGI